MGERYTTRRGDDSDWYLVDTKTGYTIACGSKRDVEDQAKRLNQQQEPTK